MQSVDDRSLTIVFHLNGPYNLEPLDFCDIEVNQCLNILSPIIPERIPQISIFTRNCSRNFSTSSCVVIV